jgi:hypothetical protein
MSPAFKEWFRTSKAVSPDGKPLVLYHGGLEWDDVSVTSTGRDALWFTTEVSVASGYADQYGERDGREVKAFHLRIERPLDLRVQDVVELVFGLEEAPSFHDIARDRDLIEQALKYAKANGFDSLIHPDSDVYNRTAPGRVSYAIFNDDQARLAPLVGDEEESNTYGIKLRGAEAEAPVSPASPKRSMRRR